MRTGGFQILRLFVLFEPVKFVFPCIFLFSLFFSMPMRNFKFVEITTHSVFPVQPPDISTSVDPNLSDRI